MNIREKLKLRYEGLRDHGPITIVALGDSVTHGALSSGEFHYDTVYHNRLRQKLNAADPYMPVNVINAGIGGTTAALGVERLERDVLCHHPDLVTVCFGLNDVNGSLETFVASLREIFRRCLEAGAEVIYMTPNMLNTSVAEDTAKEHWDYAHKTAEMQNGGRMDQYMDAARAAAREMGVPVCDCYAAWKKRSETEDITHLLANRINHPIKEMHELFAQMLADMILGEP